MENNQFFKNSQIIILGFLLAAGTIISSFIISQGLIQIKKFTGEVISVTGSAEKKINSDATVWKLNFSRRDAVMTEAFKRLKDDLKLVRDYLVNQGIKGEEIVASQVGTEVLYKKNEKGNDTNAIEAYRLTQQIEVRSSDVQKITEVSRQATELINQGIELISSAPEYFYTRLGDLKVEMLREAAKDAKKRAEEIASSTGNKIGVVRSARMGVFQITPVNSLEVSDYGVNDTTSLEKKVTAVVKADFSISS